MAETIGTAYVKVLADGDGFAADAKRQLKGADPEFEKAGKEHSEKYHDGAEKNDKKRWRQRLAALKPNLDKLADMFSRTGDKVGKAFGKGSRNDFLNIIGSMAGAAPKAAAALVGLISKLTGLGGVSKEASGGVASAGEAIGGLSKAFGVVGQIVAVAGIIKLIASGLGILGSAAVLTSGLVLALAGSLAFALVGGLVAVAGALVPFAAALGVAALAFSGLDKGSTAFKNLKKDFEDLKKSASTKLFGKDGSGLEAMSSLMKAFKPLIDGVAGALGGLLTQLGKFTKTKFFKDLMGDIGDLLPGMVTKLGGIFGNLGVFIGEAFVAAGPLINDFLGWLGDVSKALADSGIAPGAGPGGKGGGKSPLQEFFDSAAKSAKIVGGLILEVIGVIGDLLGAGKDTGDNIFVLLTEQVKKFREWLQKAKEDGSLQKFFDDAQRLGIKLGELVGAVIEFIDALDTPQSREQLLLIVGAITKIISFIAKAITWWGDFKTAVTEAVIDTAREIASSWTDMTGDIVDQWNFMVDGIVAAWDAAGAGITAAWEAIKSGFSSAIDGIVEWWNQLMTDITTSVSDTVQDISDQWTFITDGLSAAIQAVKNFFLDLWTYLVGGSLIPDLVNEIVRLFTTLPGKILAGLGNLGSIFLTWVSGIPALIGRVVIQIAQAFSGLAKKAFAKAGSIAAAFATWAVSLPGKARSIAVSVASAFVGLAKKIISRAGSIAGAFAGWVASLAGRARSAASSIVSAFAGLARKMIARAGSIASALASWLAGLPGRARGVASQVVAAFSGLARKMIARAGSIASAFAGWAAGIAGRAKGVANNIVSAFSGLASRIVAAIGTIVPKIRMPSIPRPVVEAIVKVVKPGATGFVTGGPQVRLIGEAGPEAVVPLNRPLSQVDPAVRMLSAFAQGKLKFPNGGTPGRTIDVGGITINTPTEDPRAVASEVVAHMAAASYF